MRISSYIDCKDGSEGGCSAGVFSCSAVVDDGTTILSIDPDVVVGDLAVGGCWLCIRNGVLERGLVASHHTALVSVATFPLLVPGILFSEPSATLAEINVVFASVVVGVKVADGYVAFGARVLWDPDSARSGSLLVLYFMFLLDFFQPCPYLGGVKPYRGGLCSLCNMVLELFLPLGSLILAFFGGESSFGGGLTSDRGGTLLQKGSQLLWKGPLSILSYGGWLCPGELSSVEKMSGLCPKCFDAADPFLVIYLLLRLILLDGEDLSLILLGSGLCGAVPWLQWWLFLTSGFCSLLLHPSFIFPFEVEDLFEVEAQPIEVAKSWLEEVGWRFGGLGGHYWSFSVKPENNDSIICCRAGCEQVERGMFLSPSSSLKVGGAFQNPFGLVLIRRVVCKPETSNILILCLASCIMKKEGFLSPWPCVTL